MLLLIYVANIYAAYEIAACRAQPIALVMGVAAVMPVLGPIIFLAMPKRASSRPAGRAAADSRTAHVCRGGAAAAAPVAAGIHIVEASWQRGGVAGAPSAGAGFSARTIHVQPPIF